MCDYKHETHTFMGALLFEVALPGYRIVKQKEEHKSCSSIARLATEDTQAERLTQICPTPKILIATQSFGMNKQGL